MGGGGEKTVLVLDDDPSLRLLCRVNLELDGYRVLEASSLACAREALAREAVDAVLLDVHVEDGDGRELLRELGEGRPPTALFTGTEPVGAVVHLADAVIPKPFEIGELRATVADLVSDHDRIRLQLAGPVPLVAEVTPAAVADLDLTPGAEVWVSVKAVDLAVYEH